ncbi:2-hydroxyacyl-CoA dehydratase subunit D [Chloroflexota bacterium]
MKPIPNRIDTINAFKEQGGQVAAVLPIHYPRSLFRAFNILPVEVWGPPGLASTSGSTHLQPYICSIAQNILSFLKSGGLEITDMIVSPHACDSLQGLGSLLIDFVSPSQPVFPIYIPRERRESDIEFFTAELRALFDQLSQRTPHTPDDAEIMECIQREEQADHLLADLYAKRKSLPLDDLTFYRLIRSREYLPAETFINLAGETLSAAGDYSFDRIPILLSGIVPEPMGLFEVITELGAAVVGDDLASCGRRLYPTGQSSQPFQRMVERIIHAPPDPTRGNPLKERIEYLASMVNNTGAKGIVFYEVKFCEPELFDLPILRAELGEAGIPSITIEVDINDPLSHRVRTRLEAFLEMIQ